MNHTACVEHYVSTILSALIRLKLMLPRFARHSADYDDYPSVRAAASGSGHQPTRPVDKDKTEAELSVNIKKATSAEETAPSEPVEG